jgi:hypothetical protein
MNGGNHLPSSGKHLKASSGIPDQVKVGKNDFPA